MRKFLTLSLISLLLVGCNSYCFAGQLISVPPEKPKTPVTTIFNVTPSSFNVPLAASKHIPPLHLAAAVGVNSPFTVTITVTPIVTGLTLSSSSYTGGPNNANAVIGAIQAVTNPVGSTPPAGTLTLGGTNGAQFALSSSTFPSNLLIGANNLATGTYSITITFTPA